MSRRSTRPASPQARALRLLKAQGMVRGRDLEAAGLSRPALARLVESGTIQRMGRGLYSLAGRELPPHSSLVEVACRAPRAVFCLMSALYFHDIGTQLPHRVWLFVPSGAWRPRLKSPPLEIVHCAPALLRTGIEAHVIDGVSVRVTTPARTIADCFKYRNRVGLDIALEALREGWRERKFTMDELMKQARLCRVERVMRPYLEMTVA